MDTLQLQHAKQQFSAVAERAAQGRPQVVTKHGKPFVVILSIPDWKRRTPGKRPLLEALRSCPVDLDRIVPARSRDLPREAGL